MGLCMANRDPIVDMSPAGKAWFEDQALKVDNFEKPDCPHGFLRFEMGHNRTDSSYRCTECNMHFIARMDDPEEE